MAEPTGDGPTITPPAPRAPAPDPLAEMRAILAQTQAAEASIKAERERIERLSESGKKAPDEKPLAPAPTVPGYDPATFAAMQAQLELDRKDKLVAAIKRDGFQPDWNADRILKFAPDVDPRTEAGSLALEAWRKANLDLFTSAQPERKPLLDEMIAQVIKRPEGRKEHPIWTDARLGQVVRNVFAPPEDHR